MDALNDVDAEEKESLLQDAEVAIEQSVLPAYRELEEYLRNLPTYSGDDSGVWRLPDGDEYYAYLLHHFTNTDLTADEIHQLGLNELERIHSAMRYQI